MSSTSARAGSGKAITVHGAIEHNLKDVTVGFALGTLTCFTGASGSGKSTHVHEILHLDAADAGHDDVDEIAGARVHRLRGRLLPLVGLAERLDLAPDPGDDGLTIVGAGVNPNGDNEGWIAVIPEPSTGLLLWLSLAILGARSKIHAGNG